MTLIHWLAVGCGAAIGAWIRWGLNVLLASSSLPMATLIANLLGGFLMGGSMAYFAQSSDQHTLRLFVMTGFLGGLTTFSAFSAEALSMLHKQQYAWVAIHISSHVIGSLLMTALGFAVMQYSKSNVVL